MLLIVTLSLLCKRKPYPQFTNAQEDCQFWRRCVAPSNLHIHIFELGSKESGYHRSTAVTSTKASSRIVGYQSRKSNVYATTSRKIMYGSNEMAVELWVIMLVNVTDNLAADSFRWAWKSCPGDHILLYLLVSGVVRIWWCPMLTNFPQDEEQQP